jgi:O-antigen ligase
MTLSGWIGLVNSHWVGDQRRQRSFSVMTKWNSFSRFLILRILPLLEIVIFFLTLFVALETIFNYSFITPALDADLHRFLSLFFLSGVRIQVNISLLLFDASCFVIIACLLILLVKNKIIRHLNFWLWSLPLLGILLVSNLSRFWSVATPVTVSRSLAFDAVAVGGIYLGLECAYSKIIKLFETFSILIVLANFYAIYRKPGPSIMWSGNIIAAWRGLFWWNSYAGEIIAFAAVMFLFRLANFRQNRWYVTLYSLIFYALSIFFVINTKNATELLALFAAHVVFILIASYLKWGHRLRRVHWVVIGALGLMILSGLWFGRDYLLGLIGKSPSLTGRIPLWNALIPFIHKRFLLGYGFGEAFWNNPAYPAVVWPAAGWNAPFAHNGFIEILLGTGIVGLIVWVAFLLQDTYLSVKYILQKHAISAAVFTAWIAYILVSNLTDNLLGSYEYFTWFLLTITFFFLVRQRPARKLQPPVEALDTHERDSITSN